jgi:hypothetical protein
MRVRCWSEIESESESDRERESARAIFVSSVPYNVPLRLSKKAQRRARAQRVRRVTTRRAEATSD